jgi:hypothetical protein
MTTEVCDKTDQFQSVILIFDKELINKTRTAPTLSVLASDELDPYRVLMRCLIAKLNRTDAQ